MILLPVELTGSRFRQRMCGLNDRRRGYRRRRASPHSHYYGVSGVVNRVRRSHRAVPGHARPCNARQCRDHDGRDHRGPLRRSKDRAAAPHRERDAAVAELGRTLRRLVSRRPVDRQAHLAALRTDEANLTDLIRFGRGHRFSLDHLWEEFRAFDIDERLTRFDVPIVFMLGRHDWQVPAVLAARYFERSRRRPNVPSGRGGSTQPAVRRTRALQQGHCRGAAPGG
jgi:hypothetical protein